MIWHFVFDNVLRCSCVCVWVSINMLFCNFNICCGDNNKKLSLQRKKKIFFRCCSIASSLNIHISIQQHVCLNIRVWRNRCRLLRLPSKRTRKKSSQMDTNWIWISRCRRERHASAIFSSEVAIGWADWINVTLEHTMYVMKTKLIPAICEFIQTSWTFSTVFFIRDHDDVADKVRNYLLCVVFEKESVLKPPYYELIFVWSLPWPITWSFIGSVSCWEWLWRLYVHVSTTTKKQSSESRTIRSFQTASHKKTNI